MFVRSDVSFLLRESFALWKEFNCYQIFCPGFIDIVSIQHHSNVV